MSDELQKLEALLQSGTLTPEEFQLAKQRVLEESPVTEGMGEIEEMKAQLALIQLEREWELERQKYLVSTRYGVKRMPTLYVGIVAVLVMLCPGLVIVFVEFFTRYGIQSNRDPSLKFFLLAYVVILIGVIWSAIREIIKFDRYQKAHPHYMRRRSELLGQNEPIQFEPLSN